MSDDSDSQSSKGTRHLSFSELTAEDADIYAIKAKRLNFSELTAKDKDIYSSNRSHARVPLEGVVREESYEPNVIMLHRRSNLKETSYAEDIFGKVYSDREMIRENFRSIDQRIKLEMHNANPFETMAHWLKMAFSRRYREQSPDQLLEKQLELYANNRDAMEIGKSRLDEDLKRISDYLPKAQEEFSELRSKRIELMESIKKADIELEHLRYIKPETLTSEESEEMRKRIDTLKDSIPEYESEREIIEHSMKVNDETRKSLSRNKEEFRKAYVFFTKGYETAKAEILEAKNAKELYMKVIRNNKLLELWNQFEGVYGQLRRMNELVSSSMESAGRSLTNHEKVRTGYKIDNNQKEEDRISNFKAASDSLHDEISKLTGDFD